jgi:hypothetical protein
MSAQKNIEAMIQKCETSPSVNMEVIKKKNPDGKTQDIKIMSIWINSDKKLVDDFFSAFKKDEVDADDVTTRKEKGKEVSMTLKFSNTSYYIRIQDEKNASIKIRNNSNSFDFSNNFDWDKVKFDLENLNIDWQEQSKKWEPFMKEHQEKIDSLVKISASKVKSINWDSVASEAINNMDSVIREIKQKKIEE